VKDSYREPSHLALEGASWRRRESNPRNVPNGAAAARPIDLSASDEARFWRFVERGDSSSCWPWLGKLNRGYGRFTWYVGGAQRFTGPHRVAYTLLVGAIPDGLTIDHLCRNRCCVNPAHLEPVPLNENIRRGAASRLFERGGLCRAGLHPMEPGSPNIMDKPDGPRCYACKLLSNRDARRRAQKRSGSHPKVRAADGAIDSRDGNAGVA